MATKAVAASPPQSFTALLDDLGGLGASRAPLAGPDWLAVRAVARRATKPERRACRSAWVARDAACRD
jgi:hypothetical protein